VWARSQPLAQTSSGRVLAEWRGGNSAERRRLAAGPVASDLETELVLLLLEAYFHA